MSLSEQATALLPDYSFAQLSPQAFYPLEGDDQDNQLTTWPNALSGSVREGLEAMGLKNPTPIQLRIFNVSVAREHIHAQLGDVMHGTGRSSAFSIHVADRIVRDISAYRLPRPGPAVACAAPYAIIVTPVREQAQNTQAFLAKLLERRGDISVFFMHGGLKGKIMPAPGTESAVGNIVCATASGLMIAVRDKKISAAQLKYVVLDDTDEWLNNSNYYEHLNQGLWKIIADAKKLGHGDELRYAICTTGHISNKFMKTVSSKMLNIADFTRARFKRGKQSLVHNEYKFVHASDDDALLDVLDKFVRQTWVPFLKQKGVPERALIIFVAKKADVEPVAARVRQQMGQMGATYPEVNVGSFHGDLNSGTGEKKLRGAHDLHRFNDPIVNCYVLVSTYAAAAFTFTNVPNVFCLELPSSGTRDHERARIQTWFRAASCSGTGGHKGHVWTALRLNQPADLEIVPTMIKEMEAIQLDVPQELKDILRQISTAGAAPSTAPEPVRSVPLQDRPIAKMRKPRNKGVVSSASRPSPVTDTATKDEPQAIDGVDKAASSLGDLSISASRIGNGANVAPRRSPYSAEQLACAKGLQASYKARTSHATGGGNRAASSHTPGASHATGGANRAASSPFITGMIGAVKDIGTRIDVSARRSVYEKLSQTQEM